MSAFCVYIKIGPLVFEVLSEEEPLIAESVRDYVYRQKEDILDYAFCEKIVCHVHHTTEVQVISGNVVWANPERMIFVDGEKEQRLFGFQGEVYGISRYLSENELLIEIQKEKLPEYQIDILFMEYLFLEKFLLRRQGLVLHSAFIAWNGEGIAFTAPSGTGKSTQASLWEKYAGARIINGDRSILIWNAEKECFDICGLPFCGSSGINYDERYPLKALVSLKQSKVNAVKRMSRAEIAGKLFGECSVNSWNYEAVQAALDLIEKIAEKVPAYHLACDISQNAVEELLKYIQSGADS